MTDTKRYYITIERRDDGTLVLTRLNPIEGVRENVQQATFDKLDSERLDGLIDVFVYSASAQELLEEWYDPEVSTWT